MEKVEYTESTDIASDLFVLYSKKSDSRSRDPEGLLDEVYGLRREHAADIVHLIVEQARGTCGVALIYTLRNETRGESSCVDRQNLSSCMQQWRKDEWRHSTFSASAIPEGCRVQNVFTHEVGHNFGLFHNRYSYVNYLSLTDLVGGDFPYTPYGFGYVNRNFSRAECHYTVMAGGRRCIDEGYRWAVRELMFSKPDLQLGSEKAATIQQVWRGKSGPLILIAL